MQFVKLSDEAKIMILDFLGFERNEEGIVVSKSDKKILICKYNGDPVRFADASIMPGSTIIFNTTPLSLSEYFSEYVEKEEDNKWQKTE